MSINNKNMNWPTWGKPAAYFYLQNSLNIKESMWGPKRPTQMTKTMYTHFWYKKELKVRRTQHRCSPYLEKHYKKASISLKGSPETRPGHKIGDPRTPVGPREGPHDLSRFQLTNKYELADMRKARGLLLSRKNLNIKESTWGPKRPTQIMKTMYTHF